VPEHLSFVSFVSNTSVGDGFEEDSRESKTVFMSKALRVKDKKTFCSRQVSFSNPLQ
jgi:hypothetical protein